MAIEAEEGVMQSVTFVNGHTVTRVHHDLRRVSRNVLGCPGRHVHAGHVDRLKPGLRHPLSVSRGGHKSFHGQNMKFFRRNTEFVVESVMQDVLHVGPIRDDTVLDGIHQHVAGRSSRGAAPVAITEGQFSHGGRAPGSSLQFSNRGQPI